MLKHYKNHYRLLTIDVLILPQASHPIRAYFWHSCETMLGSSGSGGPAGSGTGCAAFGKGSGQVETGNSHGASQPASTAICTVMSSTVRAATCAACVPSGSGGLSSSGAGTWRWQWRGGEEKLVDDIVQLGHMPTQTKEASHEEKLLA